MCRLCREGGRVADHVERHTAHDHEAWESVASIAHDRVGPRQAGMVFDHELSGGAQYHWSMDDASIAWSRGGRDFLHGRIR